MQRPCPPDGDVDRTLLTRDPVLVQGAMKLVRISALAFVALSAACAAQPAPAPAAPSPNAVSTTRVNAAYLPVEDDEATPRVGKAQRSDDASDTESRSTLDAPKDEPRRSESRRSWK